MVVINSSCNHPDVFHMTYGVFFLICIIDMSALIVTMLYVNIQQSLLKQYDTSLNLNEIKQ